MMESSRVAAMSSSDLKRALEVFKNGGFVIVTDDEKRENEGDLFLLASAATTEKLAFMIRYTSGVVCVAMTESRSRELHLPLMVKNNQDTKRTAFTRHRRCKSWHHHRN
jgi:3,4-dihydroxy 2-butanone 4-phosphate synthase / GTP cyclohydrolase II